MLLTPIALLALLASASASESPRLDADTHRELLLSGRPQVGLWKALTDELGKAYVRSASQHDYKRS
jgi:hypothetical protein